MRYWWVNQNQTYRHEVAGGYLWSPRRKSNGGINPFYESMREVAPFDIILSFADTRIAAIGIARSHCYAKSSQIAIVLIDGVQLADVMIEFGVGVTDVETIKLKRLDEDFFLEE